MENKVLKTELRDHQIECFEFLNNNPYGGILLPMGTGKTLIYLKLAYEQFKKGQISAIMFAAPKGAYGNFITEVEKHTEQSLLKNIDLVQWVGQNDRKIEEFSKVLLKKDGRLKIFVFNIEAISSKRSRCLAFCTKFLTIHATSFAIDEASCIKNSSSIRTEMALTLSKKAKYRFAITGSAITNSPINLWTIWLSSIRSYWCSYWYCCFSCG